MTLPLPKGIKQKAEMHPKGWGYELWFDNRPEYCGKLLFFKKGKFLSWHVHFDKVESFFLLSGKVRLLVSEQDDISKAAEIILEPGDTYFVYPGLRHRMIGIEDSQLIEVSTTHKEEDSIRIIKGD